MASTVLTGSLLAVLLLGSVIDLCEHRLPDWLTLPLMAIGLTATTILSVAELPANILAALLGFLAFWLVARFYRSLRGFDGLGLGDAKLLAAAGAWLGPLYLAPVVFSGAILALLAVLILRLAGHKISSQTALPFGPFLSAAFFSLWCFKISHAAALI